MTMKPKHKKQNDSSSPERAVYVKIGCSPINQSLLE
jgi:hypothetical protein